MTNETLTTITTGKLKHPVGDITHYAATHEYTEFGRNTCEANLEQRARVARKGEV